MTAKICFTPIEEKEFTIFIDDSPVALILRGNPWDLNLVSKKFEEVFIYDN